MDRTNTLFQKMGNFYLSAYDNDDGASRTQAKSTLVVTLILMAVAVGAAVALLVPLFRVIMLGFAGYLFCLTLLVRASRARLASLLLSLSMSVLLGSLPLVSTFQGGYELYFIGFLQCMVIAITGIIATKNVQTLAVLAIAAVALSADYGIRVGPATHGEFLGDLVIALMVTCLSAYVNYVIMRRNLERLAAAAAENLRSREQFERLARAVESSRSSLSQGIQVTESAARMMSLSARLRDSTAQVTARVSELAAKSRDLVSAQESIARSSASVSQNAVEQMGIVSESSAAVEEMTSSIRNISGVTKSRMESLERLRRTTEDGTAEIETVDRVVGEMRDSADSILDVVSVIENVAVQTNLLAMNAAIEAAHAGESGKGFAVVADEIRKLSEMTTENARIIGTSVKRTVDSIRLTGEANARAQGFFRDISKDVRTVSDSLDEVTGGIQEIASGTDQILKGSGRSVSISSRVRESLVSVDDRIREISGGLDSLNRIASDLADFIGDFGSGLETFMFEAEEMDRAGKENEEGLRLLLSTLEKL